MSNEVTAPFHGLPGALFLEEGWVVWSNWLEPPSWRGLGGAHGKCQLGPGGP